MHIANNTCSSRNGSPPTIPTHIIRVVLVNVSNCRAGKGLIGRWYDKLPSSGFDSWTVPASVLLCLRYFLLTIFSEYISSVEVLLT